MATLWPTVHGHLVSLLPRLQGWGRVVVFDGPPVTGSAPTDFVTVGFVLPEDAAGSYEFLRHSDGWGVTESGFIRCELVCSSGAASDLPALRSRAFGLLDALEAHIRADQTLSGLLRDPASCRLVVDVVPAQTTAGAQQRLPFSFEYTSTDQ